MNDVEHQGCAGCTSRRKMLAGAGGIGVAALLAGCQTYGNDAPPPVANPPVGGNPGGDPGGDPAASPGGEPVAAPPLANLADIPVGGGKIFADQGVVVTQPQAGTVKAFSAVCTHQGCNVSSVSNGTINCSCHGSKFAVATGEVAGGPAKRPLPPVNVAVDGDAIRLA